jgi:hypothetical protein
LANLTARNLASLVHTPTKKAPSVNKRGITKANEEWAFLWEKEYSFKEAYPTLSDMSADSFANLVLAMNASSSDEWDSYYTFNYKSYQGPSSLPCTGPCKSAEISFLNGSKEESY